MKKVKYILLSLLAMLFLLGLPGKHSFAADNKYELVLDIDQESIDYVIINGTKYNKSSILFVEEGTKVIIECHSKEYYDGRLTLHYFSDVPYSKYGNNGYTFVMPAKVIEIECGNWGNNPPGKVVLKATVNGKEQVIKEGDEIPEGTKVTAYFESPNKIDTSKISYKWTDYNDSETQSITVSYNDVHYIFKRERCCKIKVDGYSSDIYPYVSPSFLSVGKDTYDVNFVLTNGGKIKLEGRYNDTISSYKKDGSEPTGSYTVTKKYPYGGMVYFRLDENYPADITVTCNDTSYSRTVYTDSADPNLYYFYMTDEGGDTVTINFNDFDYNPDTIKIENTDIEYTGQVQAIHPVVKNTAGRVFKESVDYVIGNNNGRDIKSYIAYIYFNSHSSKFKKYFIFNIVPNTSGKGTVVGSYTYNGQVIKPTIKVTSDISSTDLIEGTDYTISYPKSVNAGKYEATITFKGNYGGTKKVAYTINPCKEISAKLKSDSLTYTGKTLKPTVKVSDSKGHTLKSGSDYTIKYASSSKSVGNYKIKITFKGNHTGSKTLEYKIVPKNTSITKLAAASKGFTVSWKKQTTETSGYEIRYSLKEDMSSAKTQAVKNNKTDSLKVSGLKSGKYYYVQIRTYKTVGGKKYASDWSKAQKIKTK